MFGVTPGMTDSQRVVVNRHVARHWNNFLTPHGSNRTYALCGVRTVTHATGIPGVTQQPLEFAGEPGWCLRCVNEMLDWYKNTYQHIVTFPEAEEAYNVVFWEMFRFIRYAVDNEHEWFPDYHVNN